MFEVRLEYLSLPIANRFLKLGNSISLFSSSDRLFPINQWISLIITCSRGQLTLGSPETAIIRSDYQALAHGLNRPALEVGASCNIEYVELRKVHDSAVLWRFDAVSVHRNFALCDDKSAILFCTKVELTPVPRVTLDEIGGIQVLLPFFAQLEQPTVSGTPNPIGILRRIFPLLTICLKGKKEQQEFFDAGGFQMIAVLLSVASLAKIELSEMESFRTLFEALTDIPLKIQMFESIFLSVFFWQDRPLAEQNQLYALILVPIKVFVRECPEAKNAISVRRVLFFIRSDLSELKSDGLWQLMWQFADDLADEQLLPSDVTAIISFCGLTRYPRVAE